MSLSPAVKALFRELAGASEVQRQAVYQRQAVSTTVRVEVESLLNFDEALATPITQLVHGAAEQLLAGS